MIYKRVNKQNTPSFSRVFYCLKRGEYGPNRAVGLLKTLRHIDAVNVFTVSGDNMSTLFRRARDKAGIVDLHFHDTRHQAITNLAKKLSVIQLARMVGHRDLKSLMIYYNETATELANLLN